MSAETARWVAAIGSTVGALGDVLAVVFLVLIWRRGPNDR